MKLNAVDFVLIQVTVVTAILFIHLSYFEETLNRE